MKLKLIILVLIIVTGLNCQIEFYVETDQPNYFLGQDLLLTFNVHNAYNETITLSFINTDPFEYFINNEWFVFPSGQAVTDVTFSPDSTYSVTLTHWQELEVGDYELTSIFKTVEADYYSDPIYFSVVPLDIDNSEIQDNFTSLMNYPNPFNPSTTINYLIEEKSNIKLSIHNIKGQKVIELIHCNKDRGKHSVIWDGKNSSGETINSGVYYIILNADNKRVIIKKCVLLK